MSGAEYFYLYKIINLITGKLYIGQTTQKNPLSRWKNHKDSTRDKSKPKKSKIAASMIKHGIDNFKFEVICDKCSSLEELNELEEFIISELDTVNTGYNIAAGGRNFKTTEETRKKISEALKGKPGHKISDETKIKLSIANIGRKFTDEHKEKLRLAKLGKKRGPHSEAHKLAISKANTGFVWDEERRKAQGERMKGKQIRLGKPFSEESKHKISESLKEYFANNKKEEVV